MRENNRLVYVTKAEKLWLQDFRITALKQCGDLELQRNIRDRVIPFPWRISVRISRVANDGRLDCQIWIQHRSKPISYTRKRTCRVGLGSTRGRYLTLREGTTPNTIQRNGAGLSVPKGTKTRVGAN